MLSSKEIELSDGQVSLPSVLSGSLHMNLHLRVTVTRPQKWSVLEMGLPRVLELHGGMGSYLGQ